MMFYGFSLHFVFFAMLFSVVEAGGLRLRRHKHLIEVGLGSDRRILVPCDSFLIEENDQDGKRLLFEEGEFVDRLSLSMSYVYLLSMSMVDAPSQTFPPSIESQPREPLLLRKRPSLELRNPEPLRARKRQFHNPSGGRKLSAM